MGYSSVRVGGRTGCAPHVDDVRRAPLANGAASVAVVPPVLVDLTVQIRVSPPEIWRPKRASALPFMPTAVELLTRPTPAGPLRPTMANPTTYSTSPGSSVAAHSSRRPTVATGAGGVV